jgi:hypothetical protein
MHHPNHLPALPSNGPQELGLPFIDICDMDLPVEQLGRAIMSNYEAGRAAGNEAINRLVTAGRMLIEAKSRDLNFEDFLRDHCNGLSHSWAYDLIAIARGKIEDVRAKANARKLKYRQKRAAVAGEAVRSGTDMSYQAPELSQDTLLARFEKTVNVQFRKMDDKTRHSAVSYVVNWRDDGGPIVELSPSVQ